MANVKIKHIYVTVNSDQQKDAEFDGTLADYAAEALTCMLADMEECRIISIESTPSSSEIRPSQCDSSTWYTRYNLRLSVWLETQ